MMTTARAPGSTVMAMSMAVAGAQAGTEREYLHQHAAVRERKWPDDSERRGHVRAGEHVFHEDRREHQLEPSVEVGMPLADRRAAITSG